MSTTPEWEDAARALADWSARNERWIGLVGFVIGCAVAVIFRVWRFL